MHAVIRASLFLLALVAGCVETSSQQSAPPGPKSAPAFVLAALNGEKVSLAGQKGKVVVLDFWATWCPPCREALPHLQKIATDADLAQKGLVVWAVNERENDRTIQAFLDQAHFKFTVLQDSDGTVADLYSVTSIPVTVVIGRDGLVRSVSIGYDSQTAQRIDAAINQALAELSATQP